MNNFQILVETLECLGAQKKALSFKQIAILQLISNTIAGIIGITMAYNNYGVWSLLTQLIFGKLLYSILVWFNVRWIPN